jgi:hypothetical protein
MTNDARCAGKLAFGFEGRAFGLIKLARSAGVMQLQLHIHAP